MVAADVEAVAEDEGAAPAAQLERALAPEEVERLREAVRTVAGRPEPVVPPAASPYYPTQTRLRDGGW